MAERDIPARRALREEVEEFLYEEAALLDEWRLEDWLQLFTEDARYVVPGTDFPQADSRDHFVLIDDDMRRLRGRVARLLSGRAHREHPRSRTRRLITNIRISESGNGEISVTASFAVYRSRGGRLAPYVGRYLYTLARVNGGLKIRHRRAELDLENLEESGAVSIIL
jgi:p-cumate 2,3-dioxygenase beta subunit